MLFKVKYAKNHILWVVAEIEIQNPERGSYKNAPSSAIEAGYRASISFACVLSFWLSISCIYLLF